MRIGVDLGGTKIEILALMADGSVGPRFREATPQGDYDAEVALVTAMVQRVERETGQHGTVGLGIPGTLSPKTGLVKNANSTWLNDKPLDKDLATALGRPVRLANDADCFALSEASDGAAAGAESVFGVILGTGVGAGVTVRGQILRGPNAVTGEWGHNPLPWMTPEEFPGPLCWCGLKGCTETWLSGPALLRDHAASVGNFEMGQPFTRGADLLAAAQAGDRLAQASLDRHSHRLARALAGVINLLDPDVIVLGGGLSNMDHLYAQVPLLWEQWVFGDGVDTRLVPARHGDSSGVRGAAWLWSPEEAARASAG